MAMERVGNGAGITLRQSELQWKTVPALNSLSSYKMMPVILDYGRAKPGKPQMSLKNSEKKNSVGAEK